MLFSSGKTVMFRCLIAGLSDCKVFLEDFKNCASAVCLFSSSFVNYIFGVLNLDKKSRSYYCLKEQETRGRNKKARKLIASASAHPGPAAHKRFSYKNFFNENLKNMSV